MTSPARFRCHPANGATIGSRVAERRGRRVDGLHDRREDHGAREPGGRAGAGRHGGRGQARLRAGLRLPRLSRPHLQADEGGVRHRARRRAGTLRPLHRPHGAGQHARGGGAAHRHPHLVRGERRQAPRARGHRPSGGGGGGLRRARWLRRALRRPHRAARRLRHARHRHPHAASGGLRPRADRLHRARDHAGQPHRPRSAPA